MVKKEEKLSPSARVEADLRRLVSHRKAGGSLGSELALAETHGVSRMTVRKAVDALAREGLVVRKAGVGLFVGERKSAGGRRFAFIAGNLLWDTSIRISRAARSVCEAAGCPLDLLDAEGDIAKYRRLIAEVSCSGRAGVLVMSAHDAESEEALARLGAEKFPVVVIDQDLSSRGLESVTSDNLTGGVLAAEMLIAAGRRELGFIGDFAADTVQARWQGFRSACAARDLNPAKYDLRGEDRLASWESGVETLVSRIQSLTHLPSGIFCSCDAIARYLMRSLAARGMRVPEDVSLVGFDDDPIAEWTTPALTTIRQNFAEMGRLAALRLLSGEVSDGVTFVPVTRIDRASVSGLSQLKRTSP